MRRFVVRALLLTLVCALVAIGCMDRQPKPVCPVPTEVSNSESMVQGFNGVDMLVIVDNSGSMLEEQAILATGFFTLINSLVEPTSGWPYPAVGNMRVAMVTSDMGLQYGPDGETDDSPDNIAGCGDDGDDGIFQDISATVVEIADSAIRCDEGGNQCPTDFTCEDDGSGIFYCMSPGAQDPYIINCPDPLDPDYWAETSETDYNSSLATVVSCMSAQGTTGCGIEQQLQAAPRSLERNGSAFLKDDHLLAVLIVSDEEDCSIQDSGLFETDEWKSGGIYTQGDPNSGHLNTSCNLPESNEDKYLFPTENYYDALVAAKDGNSGAVIFAAIVGVPVDEDGSPSPCQGKGTEIGDCLASSDMQLSEMLFNYPEPSTSQYYHFAPACERKDPDTGDDITTARPGRRYVKLAEWFGGNSYIYSLCNPDWSPAMESIAAVIAEAIGAQCYPKSLEWLLATDEQSPSGCTTCGAAKCNMIALIEDEAEYQECPGDLEEVSRDNDSGVFRTSCRVPKVYTPKYCDQTDEWVDETEAGWYYCENLNFENFEEACSDNIDNDGDGLVDCDDDSCVDCAICPEGSGGGTCVDTCTYAVEMTDKTKALTQGKSISIQCLQQFNFEDENCQENTREVCIDNMDNDGNGVWDCTAGSDHFPDPHCCPLTMLGDNRCTPTESYSDICEGVAVFDGDPDADTVCEAHARMLSCTLEE